jgi:uncharacterized membrane protein
MMRMAAVGGRNDLHQCRLHGIRGFTWSKTGAIRHPEDMSINRAGFMAKHHIEDHIGGLSANAGQRFERFAALRHGTTMLAQQQFGQRHDIFGFGVEQADGLDMVDQFFKPQRQHLFRCLYFFEQASGRFVDALIGRLCREHHCHKQLIGITIVKLGFRFGISGAQELEKRLDAFGTPATRHFQFYRLCHLVPFARRAYRFSSTTMDSTAPQLHLIFTPNRSLGPRGFAILMSVTASLAGLISLRFLLLSTKAWPIALLMGLDVLLLYLAFRANYRSATEREELWLDSARLNVRQRGRNGDERTFQLNPHWVKVELQELNEFQNRLHLISHGRKYTIAAFLSPHERVEIGEAIQSVLLRLKSISRNAY